MINQKGKDSLITILILWVISLVFYLIYLYDPFRLSVDWLRVEMLYTMLIVTIPLFNVPRLFFGSHKNFIQRLIGCACIFVCLLPYSIIIGSGFEETKSEDIKVIESTSISEGVVTGVSNIEYSDLDVDNPKDFKNFSVVSNGEAKVYKNISYKQSKGLGEKVSKLEKVKYSKTIKTIVGKEIYKLSEERYILK